MKQPQMTRRDFVAHMAVGSLGVMATARWCAAAPAGRWKKALIGTPSRPTLESWKAAGFDGMETNAWDVSPDMAAEGRRIADELGMPIHSVMRGWANFNSPDADQVKKDIASVEKALRAAEAYGADTILLVPCRLKGNVNLPRPEEFEIEFDLQTGHVRRVVAGDNKPYAEYIQEQNRATDATRKAVEQLIPVAEKTGVVIALENVWNNFWVKPPLAKQLVASFQSPWVRFYFDIGNHVKYAPPEEWIRTLGGLIAKLHVKDFTIDRASRQGGKFVDIRDGDVNWPAVERAVQAVGYAGWWTIEGSGGLPLPEQSRRLDLILAGE